MTDVPFKDSTNATQTLQANLTLGRKAANLLRGVALSDEDATFLATLSADMALMKDDVASLLSAYNTPETGLPPVDLVKTTRYSRKIVDITPTANTEFNLIAGVAGQTIRVHYFRLLTPVAANELQIWNGPVSDALQQDLLSFAGAGAGLRDLNETDPLWIASTAKNLVGKATGTARITGLILYQQSV